MVNQAAGCNLRHWISCTFHRCSWTSPGARAGGYHPCPSWCDTPRDVAPARNLRILCAKIFEFHALISLNQQGLLSLELQQAAVVLWNGLINGLINYSYGLLQMVKRKARRWVHFPICAHRNFIHDIMHQFWASHQWNLTQPTNQPEINATKQEQKLVLKQMQACPATGAQSQPV